MSVIVPPAFGKFAAPLPVDAKLLPELKVKREALPDVDQAPRLPSKVLFTKVVAAWLEAAVTQSAMTGRRSDLIFMVVVGLCLFGCRVGDWVSCDTGCIAFRSRDSQRISF